MKMRVILAAAFTMAACSSAFADTWADKFKILDSNGDGDVSQVEWEANWPKLKMDPTPTFRALNKDGNNRVDLAEWMAMEKEYAAYGVPPGRKAVKTSAKPATAKLERPPAKRSAHSEWADKFKILDSNGDGDVSQVEWAANWPKLKMDPTPTFRALDKDGNNRVDLAEWMAMEKEYANYGVAPGKKKTAKSSKAQKSSALEHSSHRHRKSRSCSRFAESRTGSKRLCAEQVFKRNRVALSLNML